jgi:hypothetical protein
MALGVLELEPAKQYNTIQYKYNEDISFQAPDRCHSFFLPNFV